MALARALSSQSDFKLMHYPSGGGFPPAQSTAVSASGRLSSNNSSIAPTACGHRAPLRAAALKTGEP